MDISQEAGKKMSKQNPKKDFQQQALQKRSNIVLEFLGFLAHNKKWWLLPILLILLLMGLLILFSSTAIAPFIYPLI